MVVRRASGGLILWLAIVLVPSTAMVIVVSWLPSTTSSSNPVTVTTWASSQLVFVNSNAIGSTVATPASVTDTKSHTGSTG